MKKIKIYSMVLLLFVFSILNAYEMAIGVLTASEANVSTYSSSGNTVVEEKTLTKSTRLYSYNPDGRCGSVAAAIVLRYYYDNYSTNYLPSSSYATSDGVSLINLLTSYYIPTWSSYSQLKSGLETYLTERFSYTGSTFFGN